MAGYIIADIKVTDPERFEEYRRLGTLATEKFGGRYLARGGAVESLEGDWLPSRLVIIGFDSFERAKAWGASMEYALARQARVDAAEFRMIVTEGPDF
ncbi:DUF1330 domain-containing protein [Paracoccus yeei]|jgi:uncharacterized protein (DUF1330 family)|uniref:DUF1330 domain-containing protein n=1 Tax=Paracoccus yeei TaxID=147645 RepID=A0A386UJG9_9RHOB|nr:DUF1330 domain-containing protein [Paracoccus yeei]AYF00844.1 DUF1330 domain-containing protein [Paracoccus yeei]